MYEEGVPLNNLWDTLLCFPVLVKNRMVLFSLRIHLIGYGEATVCLRAYSGSNDPGNSYTEGVFYKAREFPNQDFISSQLRIGAF